VNYVISKEAESDLEKIWLYTFENWSIEQADRYLNLLLNEFEYLCLKPYSGTSLEKIRKIIGVQRLIHISFSTKSRAMKFKSSEFYTK
jgi:plasmid stabilization system protein ParE